MEHIIALYVLNIRAVILEWSNLEWDDEHTLNKLIKYRDQFSRPGFDVRLEVNPILTEDIINSKDYQAYVDIAKQAAIYRAEQEEEKRKKLEAENDPAFKKVLEGLELFAKEPAEIPIIQVNHWEE